MALSDFCREDNHADCRIEVNRECACLCHTMGTPAGYRRCIQYDYRARARATNRSGRAYWSRQIRKSELMLEQLERKAQP